MGFERVYRQQGGGGGLVAGYNKTKKSVSKQDMLQCWSKYVLNFIAFLSFQKPSRIFSKFNPLNLETD